MADLLFTPTPNGGQISFTSKGDFKTTNAIFNSAYIALFSGPFWGNQLSLPSHRIVSKLHELFNDTITSSTRNKAERYTKQALDYLLSENIASDLEVDVVIQNATYILIGIQITQPDGNILEFTFGMNWKSQSIEFGFAGQIG